MHPLAALPDNVLISDQCLLEPVEGASSHGPLRGWLNIEPPQPPIRGSVSSSGG
jgi:hypothetical protein